MRTLMAGLGLAGLVMAAAPAYTAAEIFMSDRDGIVVVDGPHQGESYEFLVAETIGESVGGGMMRDMAQASPRYRPLIMPPVTYGYAVDEFGKGFDVVISGDVNCSNTQLNGIFQIRQEYFIRTQEGTTLDFIAHVLTGLRQENITWQELYAQNKDVIGPKPHHIHPGMDLTFTTEWYQNKRGEERTGY